MPLQHLRDVAKAVRKLQRNNNNATTQQSTTKKQQEQQQQEPTQQRDYSYNNYNNNRHNNETTTQQQQQQQQTQQRNNNNNETTTTNTTTTLLERPREWMRITVCRLGPHRVPFHKWMVLMMSPIPVTLPKFTSGVSITHPRQEVQGVEYVPLSRIVYQL